MLVECTQVVHKLNVDFVKCFAELNIRFNKLQMNSNVLNAIAVSKVDMANFFSSVCVFFMMFSKDCNGFNDNYMKFKISASVGTVGIFVSQEDHNGELNINMSYNLRKIKSMMQMIISCCVFRAKYKDQNICVFVGDNLEFVKTHNIVSEIDLEKHNAYLRYIRKFLKFKFV